MVVAYCQENFNGRASVRKYREIYAGDNLWPPTISNTVYPIERTWMFSSKSNAERSKNFQSDPTKSRD